MNKPKGFYVLLWVLFLFFILILKWEEIVEFSSHKLKLSSD